MHTVLLTGGAGFIGREIIRSLNGPHPLDGRSYQVDIMDTDEAFFKNARHISKFRRFIRASEKLDNLVGYYDFVIHAGAISDSRCDDVGALIETNYELTKKLVDRVDHRFGQMIYFSSASVYGDGPCDERRMRFEPQTHYATSKMIAEKEVIGQKRCCVVRPFNVYGSGEFSKKEHTRSLLYRIAHAAGTGKSMTVFAREAQRDFISSYDVAESVVRIMEGPSLNGEVYNLGTGKPIAVSELCSTAVKAAGDGSWLKGGDNPYGSAYQSFSCALFHDGKTRPYDPKTFRDPLKDLELMVKRFKLGEVLEND